MMNYIFIALLIFLSATLLVYGVAKVLNEFIVNRRINSVVQETRPKRLRAIAPLIDPDKLKLIIRKMNELSKPTDGWQDSSIKLRFMRTGWRHESVPTIFYAIKTCLSIVAPLLFILISHFFFLQLSSINSLMISLLLAASGYYLPELFISHRINQRAQEMRNSLPDFIDLLVMCTASGLGMDAALNRVSLEMAKSSPTLAEEFYLSCLEIRAGAARMDALKNLALRVNLDDLSNLVTMLVQADKFGSSLTDSMKIQSEFMRIKRMQRAEAVAAKIPVKMLLPLIFFIFPILMFVLIGPAFIQMSTAFAK